MSSADKLRKKFKRQFREAFDEHTETDPVCSYAAGMLLILSALKVKDGPTLSTQIAIMHKALREVGEERGWGVEPRQRHPRGVDPMFDDLFGELGDGSEN